YLLFGGAILSGLVVAGALRQRRRPDLFWLLYGGVLLLAALEESDWLKQSGLTVRILGHRYSALHDVLATGVKPFRAGAVDYPFAATTVVLTTATAAAGVVLLLRWAVSRTRRLDFGLLALVGLGLFFVSLGTLIDADLLPKPVAIDWKAHLEEPLETVGAVCLALVSLEGLLRGSGGGASPP
ncbi:MAG: hypothetical protein IT429_13380, partial [Gemmataceae bacterium]|nr:hypothetical protein [Gemmataceae bacterium]